MNTSLLSAVCLLVAVSLVPTTLASVNDDIAQRLSPVGSLCMSGSDCAAAPVTVASGPRSGEEIYSSKCMACHVAGVAGAPKFGDASAWAPRIAKGLDALYANAIGGIGGMPAKGLCMDCSDEEIQVTVDYMVENGQ